MHPPTPFGERLPHTPEGRGIVCLVTDRRVLTRDRLREAIAAGVDLVQVREPDLDGAALFALTRDIVEASSGALVVVNDRLDVALAARAHGVHLRSDSFPAARVRALAHPMFLVGRSVHAPGEAAAADADYLIFGTVFASAGKPAGHPVAGVDGLREACAAAAVPVLAIGGITPDRAPAVAAAGAAGVAGIRLFQQGHPKDTIARLREAFAR